MKESYCTPQIEVELLQLTDIVTESPPSDDVTTPVIFWKKHCGSIIVSIVLFLFQRDDLHDYVCNIFVITCSKIGQKTVFNIFNTN